MPYQNLHYYEQDFLYCFHCQGYTTFYWVKSLNKWECGTCNNFLNKKGGPK